MPTPTELSIRCMKERGYVMELATWPQRHSTRTRDVFGFVDYFALKTGQCIALQITDYTHRSHRRRKITTKCAAVAKLWLSVPGNRILIHGWQHRENGWNPREMEILLEGGQLAALDTVTLAKS